MNEFNRAITSVIAAAGAISLEHISTVFSIAAAIVAILAGLPMAIKTLQSFFGPPPPPAPQAFAAA